jgi:hypothetical protein
VTLYGSPAPCAGSSRAPDLDRGLGLRVYTLGLFAPGLAPEARLESERRDVGAGLKLPDQRMRPGPRAKPGPDTGIGWFSDCSRHRAAHSTRLELGVKQSRVGEVLNRLQKIPINH